MYDDILIVFSARKTDKGKFTFYKQVIDFPATLIFVNDYDTEWYLNGTPEFHDSLDLVNYLIGQIYRLKRKNTKVWTLGSSMGAYAALLYGSLLQVDKVLAFGPESELCIPLGRSVESLGDTYPEGYADISKLFYKSPKDVLIISGNNDIPDLYCASMFRAGNKNIEIKLINNYTHVVAKYIHEKVILSTFLLAYFTSSVEDILATFELGYILSPDHALSVKKFNEALTLKKTILVSEKSQIIEVSKTHPNWSMLLYYTGLIYEKEKNNKEAIINLKKALNVQDNLGRARFKLAQIYYKEKDFNKAEKELFLLKKQKFTYNIGILLSRIYIAQERVDMYKDILQEMQKELTLKNKEKENILSLLDSVDVVESKIIN